MGQFVIFIYTPGEFMKRILLVFLFLFFCSPVLALQNLYFNGFISDNAQVITSGLGGKAPKGIYIGTVTGSSVSEDGTSTTVQVKPAADFNDLSYVAVVFRSDSNE